MSNSGLFLLFWALVAALAGLGLAIVLPPLLRAGPHGQGAAGGEAGEGASEDLRGRWTGYALAGLLPAFSVGIYLLLGSPAALTAGPAAAAGSAGADEDASELALRERLPALRARVNAAPQDGEAWAALARTLSSLGEYADAVPAFAEATRLLPERAQAWSGYAEALAISRGHALEGEPYEMALKAVELDMNDPKGLELLGIYHFQQGSYGQAAYYWRRLARLLPPESPFGQDIAAAAAEAAARARALLDAPADAGAAAPPADTPRASAP